MSENVSVLLALLVLVSIGYIYKKSFDYFKRAKVLGLINIGVVGLAGPGFSCLWLNFFSEKYDPVFEKGRS